MSRYILLDYRVSRSYYTYCLELINKRTNMIVESVCYGDNTDRSYFEAREIVERRIAELGIDRSQITFCHDNLFDEVWCV